MSKGRRCATGARRDLSWVDFSRDGKGEEALVSVAVKRLVDAVWGRHARGGDWVFRDWDMSFSNSAVQYQRSTNPGNSALMV